MPKNQDASSQSQNLQPTNNNKKSDLNNQTFIDLQCLKKNLKQKKPKFNPT